MPKSLKLSLLKPDFLEKRMALNDLIYIQANIIGEDLDTCIVIIKYDIKHFDLVEGDESRILWSGSFSEQVTWVLKAIKTSYSYLWTEVNARAGDLFQVAGFDIKIINN